jgi:hypothetical protein
VLAENLDALKCGGWGVFIALTTKMVVGEGFCRRAHRTECASHVTQPLGFDRWISDMWGHRTVRWCTRQSLFTVWCAICACSDFCARNPRTVAHCSPFADDRWRCSRYSAWHTGQSGATPDSPVLHRTVRWIIAERQSQKPEASKLELIHPGALDSPVRQTRAAFGFLCSFDLNPFFYICIGLLWTFGTCGTYTRTN